jgi:hypothetical protein
LKLAAASVEGRFTRRRGWLAPAHGGRLPASKGRSHCQTMQTLHDTMMSAIRSRKRRKTMTAPGVSTMRPGVASAVLSIVRVGVAEQRQP